MNSSNYRISSDAIIYCYAPIFYSSFTIHDYVLHHSLLYFVVRIGERMIFNRSFQVSRRELRVLSTVPESCLVGSCLEKIVFGVFDFEGEIDHTIHGKHHTLSISAESWKKDDKIIYIFNKGCCIVPVVRVPSEPKIFRFSAFHSKYRDLRTSIKVNLVQAPKLNFSPSIQLDDRNLLAPFNEGLSEHEDPAMRSTSQIGFLESFVDYTAKLDDGLAELGHRVGRLERNLKILNYQKKQILQEIFELKGLVDQPQLSQIEFLVNTKEHVRKQVEEQGNTAAAAFFHLSNANTTEGPQFDYMADIIGVVALLGIVNNYQLSSILAEYLGETYMLAIVCKSYDTASALEKHGEDGAVEHNCALHAAAAAIGIRIERRFNVICLEEIRPYEGLVSDGTERKLAIPSPQFPSGEIPNGFLGYAVNMINPDILHMNTRTTSGFGLRETLFYQLFGDLQVYRTRSDMQQAGSCINQAAVSLDGGIIVTNGIIVFGDSEPEIKFPVVPDFQEVISDIAMKILRQIEDKRVILEAKNKEIESEAQARSKALSKFHKKKETLCLLLPQL